MVIIFKLVSPPCRVFFLPSSSLSFPLCFGLCLSFSRFPSSVWWDSVVGSPVRGIAKLEAFGCGCGLLTLSLADAESCWRVICMAVRLKISTGIFRSFLLACSCSLEKTPSLSCLESEDGAASASRSQWGWGGWVRVGGCSQYPPLFAYLPYFMWGTLALTYAWGPLLKRPSHVPCPVTCSPVCPARESAVLSSAECQIASGGLSASWSEFQLILLTLAPDPMSLEEPKNMNLLYFTNP